VIKTIKMEMVRFDQLSVIKKHFYTLNMDYYPSCCCGAKLLKNTDASGIASKKERTSATDWAICTPNNADRRGGQNGGRKNRPWRQLPKQSFVPLPMV
jgi:hypothetical protein